MSNPPIANAPRGYLWRWNTYRIAHLVSIKVRRQALCGAHASGAHLSTQVGGYAAAPCVTCLQEVEMANKKGDAVLALSIHQPWAWLIVNGYKDVENRTWALPKTFTVPQRIYVHAGKSQSDMSKDSIARIILSILTYPADTDFMLAWTTPVLPSDFGAIVGEVTITDCVRESDSPWFTGDYGFTLADPVAYDEPIPYPGSLGFFRVDLEGRTVNAGRR